MAAETGQNLKKYLNITNFILCNLSETLMATIYLLTEKPTRNDPIFINYNTSFSIFNKLYGNFLVIRFNIS